MALAAVVKVNLPVGVADSVTSITGTSTSAIALPSGALKVWLSAAEQIHVIFGTSAVAAAVVATCAPLQPDTDYVFDVPAGVTHFRAIRNSATGDLYCAAVG